MLDSHSLVFTITDLKQYMYCPRIFYYQACLPAIRPITYKMQTGIEAHDAERKRALRRSLKMYDLDAGKRHFDVRVQSAALRLSGQIDEVIETDAEYIPVDYKFTRKVGYHFKIQLAAYALLLESEFHCAVKKGFLYLIPSRQTIEVPINSKLRREIQRALETMWQIAEREQMPSPTEWQQRCVDCEFRRFCNDV